MVEQQPGWKLKIYYGAASSAQLYERPNKTQLEAQLHEAMTLGTAGYLRAAFILGWAALEAMARTVSNEEGKVRAMMPRELIGWLAQEGHVDQETRRSLRDLVPIRNAVVHGSTEIDIRKEHWATLERVLNLSA